MNAVATVSDRFFLNRAPQGNRHRWNSQSARPPANYSYSVLVQFMPGKSVHARNFP